MSNTAETATRRRRRTKGSTSAKTDPAKTVKATIVMDRKLDFLLSTIASYRGLDRSELASSLIDQGLKKDQADLYKALEAFKPQIAVKAKPDAPGGNTDRAVGGLGVRDDESAAA